MSRIDWQYTTPGIPDHFFSRGNVPMTKEEVRVLTLAKARLGKGMTVYDIGAGTGSLSIEAAMLVRHGNVWAVETKLEACLLIRENADKFGLQNLKIKTGTAPEALEGLPPPDRVIIGGSGGRLKEILDTCHQRVVKGGILVVNAVTVDTMHCTLEFAREGGYRPEVLAVNIARLEPVGHTGIWRALNPVYIISLVKEQ